MIILASKSPRREQLLKDAGIEFIMHPSDIDEFVDQNMPPESIVLELAKQKAEDVATKYQDHLVIGADTIVVYQDEILGKPKNEDDAFRMLRLLSGKTHSVFTGVTLVKGHKKKSFYSESKVTMKTLSDKEIINYIETKEPMDKAGAYAIQGLGKHIVDTYEGDFYTIVGLPIEKLLEAIKSIDE